MSAFERAVKHVLGVEGDFSDHPSDRGGKTRWGITEPVARRRGYGGHMKDLPVDFALRIYRADYWDKMNLDLIAAHSEKIAHELFDSGVNCGTGLAQVWLQRVLNVANKRGALYADVRMDGEIGPVTAAALSALLKVRGKDGETVVFRALNGIQSFHYTTLAERDETQEDFWYGWHLNRVK